MISIAYMTNRYQPMIEWFFRSLHREVGGNWDGIKVIVVDLYADQPGRTQIFKNLAPQGLQFVHVTPKPTPWQGSSRLTDYDYFAASNARNTALCLAEDGYVVFVDDLSVLLHGWWNAVKQHADANRVVAGAYRKVLKLTVDESANLTYWLPMEKGGGIDSRWINERTGPVPCSGQSVFGCSFGIPVERMLEVNGFDECLDGLGFEDACFGLRLQKAGFECVYDQRMLTFESEERHHTETNKKRSLNRAIDGFQDCAWEMLDWIGRQTTPRSRGTPDLRLIRGVVLSGGQFPMHCGFFMWPDGRDLMGNKSEQ